jgi:hypothetical protein
LIRSDVLCLCRTVSDGDDYRTRDYWFPDATRMAAELLLGPAPMASFLLRPSSQPGAVAISIKQSGGIEHALIEPSGSGFRIQLANELKQGASIASLIASLVPHYLQPNPLTAAQRELHAQRSTNTLMLPNAANLAAATTTTTTTTTAAVDEDGPFDPKAQKYHRGVSRLPSRRADLGYGPAPLPPITAPPPVAAEPGIVDDRPPLPLRSSSLGFLRTVMPRPAIVAAVAAASAAPAAPAPDVPIATVETSATASTASTATAAADDLRDVRASPSTVRRHGHGQHLSLSLDDAASSSTGGESPRKLSNGSDASGSPPASPRLLASLAMSSASASAGDDRDFSSLPALLAYFVTLEKAYADDVQETMHKTKQQLEGCLEHDLSVTEGSQILDLLRALPELHDMARRCVHALQPMTPIGAAARVLTSLADGMNTAHCRYASLLAATSAPLASLAGNERRAPRAQPPSATWQYLVAQAATVTKSGARVPLAAQLQRPLKAVDRHATMARALRRYAAKNSVVDESTLLSIENAVAATAAGAADVAAAWASSLGRARLAAVFDKLSRSKSGRRSGLLLHERTLRMEGLDMYIGKTRHCLWLFSDFLLLVRPTKDNKSYDLVWEQELGFSGSDPVVAEAGKKLGAHAFVLRCGKGKRFDMETASDVEAQRWIAAINKA